MNGIKQKPEKTRPLRPRVPEEEHPRTPQFFLNSLFNIACQLKLVCRQKPVPSLPRSWRKPTVPDSENFAQCVHSSKNSFFLKTFHTPLSVVRRKGVFSCRHWSVSAYAQHSWETIGRIYRWTFMSDCDDDAVCIIIKPIMHQSYMYGREREYIDWYLLFSCICTLSLSLSLSVSGDYWVCKVVAICCLQ